MEGNETEDVFVLDVQVVMEPPAPPHDAAAPTTAAPVRRVVLREPLAGRRK